MGDPRRIHTPSGRISSCPSFFHATLLAFHTSNVCRIECSIPNLPCRGVPTDKRCRGKGCVCPKKTKELKDLHPKSYPTMTEFEKYLYFTMIFIQLFFSRSIFLTLAHPESVMLRYNIMDAQNILESSRESYTLYYYYSRADRIPCSKKPMAVCKNPSSQQATYTLKLKLRKTRLACICTVIVVIVCELHT